jgi:hypothetical protein
MKMLREPAVLDKVAMGKTKFDKDYIKTGRAKWLYSGRVKRMPEHEVDRLIAEDIAASAASTAPRPRVGVRRAEPARRRRVDARS